MNSRGVHGIPLTTPWKASKIAQHAPPRPCGPSIPRPNFPGEENAVGSGIDVASSPKPRATGLGRLALGSFEALQASVHPAAVEIHGMGAHDHRRIARELNGGNPGGTRVEGFPMVRQNLVEQFGCLAALECVSGQGEFMPERAQRIGLADVTILGKILNR